MWHSSFTAFTECYQYTHSCTFFYRSENSYLQHFHFNSNKRRKSFSKKRYCHSFGIIYQHQSIYTDANHSKISANAWATLCNGLKSRLMLPNVLLYICLCLGGFSRIGCWLRNDAVVCVQQKKFPWNVIEKFCHSFMSRLRIWPERSQNLLCHYTVKWHQRNERRKK